MYRRKLWNKIQLSMIMGVNHKVVAHHCLSKDLIQLYLEALQHKEIILEATVGRIIMQEMRI